MQEFDYANYNYHDLYEKACAQNIYVEYLIPANSADWYIYEYAYDKTSQLSESERKDFFNKLAAAIYSKYVIENVSISVIEEFLCGIDRELSPEEIIEELDNAEL